jgi:glycosyltransferase involved in cell wall biosynthesis
VQAWRRNLGDTSVEPHARTIRIGSLQPGDSGMTLRMLVVAGDTYPATRVDVATLFVGHLAARGHHFDWILQSEAATESSEIVPWGTGQVWVGRTNTGTSLLSRTTKHVLGILHDLRLFPLMASGRYDIIQVRDKFLSGIFAAIAARIFRKRFVYWLSFPIPEMYMLLADEAQGLYKMLYRIRGATFRLLLYRLLMPAASHVFVQTDRMLEDVSRQGIAKEKMTAVPMGVDIEADLSAVTSQRMIPAGERTLLYLGTLTRTRHLDFLVRVLAKARESIPNVKLYVVGGGVAPGDEEVLTREASRLGVSEALVMVGQRPRAVALAYVRDAEICVSPIYRSPIYDCGSPTKLVEYMAMGKAVVANDHPEQLQILNESLAGYCVPWDEDAFAAAIVRLLNDPAEAKRMGERGARYIAQRRRYDVIADVVERELVKLVAPRAGAQSEGA